METHGPQISTSQERSEFIHTMIQKNKGSQRCILGERASVALEYVLVSSFAAVAGIALLGLAASIFKSKVDSMMESLDLDPGEYRLSPFESYNEP